MRTNSLMGRLGRVERSLREGDEQLSRIVLVSVRDRTELACFRERRAELDEAIALLPEGIESVSFRELLALVDKQKKQQ
jgi:hypothetical protein